MDANQLISIYAPFNPSQTANAIASIASIASIAAYAGDAAFLGLEDLPRFWIP